MTYSKEFRELIKDDTLAFSNYLKKENFTKEYFESVEKISEKLIESLRYFIQVYKESLSQEEISKREELKESVSQFGKLISYFDSFFRGIEAGIIIYLGIYLIDKNLKKNGFKLKDIFLNKLPSVFLGFMDEILYTISTNKEGKIPLINFKIPNFNDEVNKRRGCPIIQKFQNGSFQLRVYREFCEIFEKIIELFSYETNIYEEARRNNNLDRTKIQNPYRLLIGDMPFNREFLLSNPETFEEIKKI